MDKDMGDPGGVTTVSSSASRGRPAWFSIETAPQDGTRFVGRRTYADKWTGKLRYEKRRTWFGKTSHVPLYGWCWGRDPEDTNLWQPTHWQPLLSGVASATGVDPSTATSEQQPLQETDHDR